MFASVNGVAIIFIVLIIIKALKIRMIFSEFLRVAIQ